MTDPTSEQQQQYEALAIVAMFGRRAEEVVNELLTACRADDGDTGGRLCQEMIGNPAILMLVISILTSTVVKLQDTWGEGVPPEVLGIDPEELGQREPWQTSANDQIEAAGKEAELTGEVDKVAEMIVDAQIRALSIDFHQHMADHGHYPDIGSVVRGMLLLNRSTCTVVAAEAIRRLTLLDVSR